MSPIGVMGGKWTLPYEFPLTVAGNSGDLIHTMAPLNILPEAIYSTDPLIGISGAGSFRPFVNDHASHLVVVLANTLRSGVDNGAKYKRLQHALEQYSKPIVVFGLGVQAASTRLEDVSLPDEAIELMQFLSSKTNALGVRGPFTKLVLEELCSVTNAYVTGCPSLFARPEGIRALYEQEQRGTSPSPRQAVLQCHGSRTSCRTNASLARNPLRRLSDRACIPSGVRVPCRAQ